MPHPVRYSIPAHHYPSYRYPINKYKEIIILPEKTLVGFNEVDGQCTYVRWHSIGQLDTITKLSAGDMQLLTQLVILIK